MTEEGTGAEGIRLSPLELSERFGVSRRRVYDWIYFGWLRASRSGHRWWVGGRDAAFFEATSRGYRGRLIPSLHDWERLWETRGTEESRQTGKVRTSMGLLAPAAPGSLLKDIKLVKAVDPPKKKNESGTTRSAKDKDNAKSKGDKENTRGDDERPQEPAD